MPFTMETKPALGSSVVETVSNDQRGSVEADASGAAYHQDGEGNNTAILESDTQQEEKAVSPSHLGASEDETTTTTATATSTTHKGGGEKRQWKEISQVGWSVEWVNQDLAKLTLLGKGVNVSLAGRGAVCCRAGTVTGHGFLLEPNQWYPFECPKWSSWLVLETDSEHACVEVKDRALGEFCQTDVTDESAVRHGPSIPVHLHAQDPANHSTFSIHNTEDPQSRPTLILPSWREAGDSIIEAPRKITAGDTKKDGAPRPKVIAVIGAKGVGKSTFVRYLAHRFLSQDERYVYILDGDTGQAEFGPPGLVTLTCLRQRKPMWSLPHNHMLAGQATNSNPLAPPNATQTAIFYGGISSQLDPLRYLQSMAQLVETYRAASDAQYSPLIVNLDGWVKGLGYQVLSTFLTTHEPSHVVQIVGTTATQQVDVCSIVTNTTLVHTIPSYRSRVNVSTALSVPPSAWRSLRFVHYWLNDPSFEVHFSQNDLIQDDEGTIAQRLASQRPYMVPWADISCQDADGTEIAPEALNGSIVGLCRGLSSTDQNVPECVGLGIIRGVDISNQLFYVLTPVVSASLQGVQTFVLGNLSLPIECIFLGAKGSSFPFQAGRSMTDVIIGTDPMKSRNSLLRKGLNT